jgi:radical SAM protein with 4Fe4S-binding SPASM domain
MVQPDPKFHEYNGWSFSKYQLWNKCQRAYYFQYIGSYIKSPQPFDSSKLYWLRKDLVPKVFIQGQIIHNVIENQLNRHKIGRDMDEASAIYQYTSKVKKYQETASSTVTEFFNGESADDSFFEGIAKSGTDQIQNFFHIVWPQFEGLEYVDHENKGKFSINKTPVLLRPDYVSKTKTGLFVISDWKTGSDNEDFENDKQIATYVLWAIYHYNLKPEEIRSELIYLSSGKSKAFEFNCEQLEDTREFIQDNFALLNKTYEYDDFPPQSTQKNCKNCNFASICDSRCENRINSYDHLLVAKKKD